MQTYHLISQINKIENSSDPDDSTFIQLAIKMKLAQKIL